LKKIPLRPYGFALVDDEDFELVNKYAWERHAQGYARMNSYHKPRLMMHRLIMGSPSGRQVDHINRLKWDNRRSNLRIATHGQNQANKALQNKTGYRGVSFSGYSYCAGLRHDGKNVYLGRFKNPQEAAQAYNKAAFEIWGEFALLNDL
jgi:hypothetical protein